MSYVNSISKKNEVLEKVWIHQENTLHHFQMSSLFEWFLWHDIRLFSMLYINDFDFKKENPLSRNDKYTM